MAHIVTRSYQVYQALPTWTIYQVSEIWSNHIGPPIRNRNPCPMRSREVTWLWFMETVGWGVPSRVELSCYIMFPTKNHALWSTITNPIINLSTNSPRISGSSTTYGRMHSTYHILPIPIMEEAPENGCAWIKWMKWYPWFQRKNPGSRNFSHRCSSIIPDPCWNQLGDFSSHLGVGLVCIACCSRWLSLVLSCESRPPQLYWLVVYLPLLKNMSSSVGKDDIPCIMEK